MKHLDFVELDPALRILDSGERAVVYRDPHLFYVPIKEVYRMSLVHQPRGFDALDKVGFDALDKDGWVHYTNLNIRSEEEIEIPEQIQVENIDCLKSLNHRTVEGNRLHIPRTLNIYTLENNLTVITTPNLDICVWRLIPRPKPELMYVGYSRVLWC